MQRRQSRRAGWRARLRYRFDLALSRGPGVVIGWLGALTVLVFLVAGLLLWALGLDGVGDAGRLGLVEGWWQALLRLLDPGTFSGDTSWPTRLVTLAVTLAGIFIAGSLIGLIAAAVDQRVEGLRKGRSVVLEREHVLVLGWSPRVPALVAQLVLSNMSERRASIVVLAEEDKTTMEDVLRAHIRSWGGTRLVCRTGNPGLSADLERVNVREARAVVVVSDGHDARSVKAVLAIKALDPTLLSCPLAVEAFDDEVARSLRVLTDGRVLTVNADQLISELTAQACRQPGLTQVYRELLDFDGAELYVRRAPELDGLTYGDALLSFDQASVVGLSRPGTGVQLNPDHDTRLCDGDQIIAVAEDDSTFLVSPRLEPERPEPRRTEASSSRPQHVLLVGWSDLGPRLLRELDDFLDTGAVVDVVVDSDLVDPTDVAVECLEHASLRVHAVAAGPETVASVVAGIDVDRAIVVSYRDGLAAADADARTLLTLLALRRVWPAGSPGSPTIVAEVLDRADVELALATGVDDWIVSDDLTSLMLAQLAQHAELFTVFEELFDAEGATLSLEPAVRYSDGGVWPFGSLVAAASSVGESAVGYRDGRTGAVVLNPHKAQEVQLGEGDQLLVVRGRPSRPRQPAPVGVFSSAAD